MRRKTSERTETEEQEEISSAVAEIEFRDLSFGFSFVIRVLMRYGW
jgi:hypothetical protein